jgi:hypothetical protein
MDINLIIHYGSVFIICMLLLYMVIHYLTSNMQCNIDDSYIYIIAIMLAIVITGVYYYLTANKNKTKIESKESELIWDTSDKVEPLGTTTATSPMTNTATATTMSENTTANDASEINNMNHLKSKKRNRPKVEE